MKREATNQEEALTDHVSNQGFIWAVREELSKFSSKNAQSASLENGQKT